VEKDLFIEVLRKYSECSAEEALEVLALKESYPYSQLLHALSARMSKDHGLSNQGAELQLAAVYAADRGILKDVMTLDSHKLLETKKIKKRTTEDVAVAKVVIPATRHSTSSSLADEVMMDLERLHQLKENFEMLFPDEGSVDLKSVKTAEKPAPPKGKPAPIASETRAESARSKKERIVAMAKALEASKDTEAREIPTQETAEKKKRRPGEAIIDEIASTREEIKPESEKQKEQLEIIDQFIKTQPSISRGKDHPLNGPDGDLSTIKTGEFSDNVVSETLVEILVKQGKNDKAIEVLKKLIWKFPQKKAYFAAQIEELKK